MRKTRPGLTLLLACLVIFALAPAASAQLLDPIGGIGDPLGGDTGGTIGDVVDGVDDTLGGGTTTDDGTKDADLIDDITKDVKDTVTNPEKTIEETTNDPIGSVGGTIGSTTDGATNDLNDVSKGLTGADGKDGKDRKKKTTTKDGVTTGSGRLAAASARHDKVFDQSLAARLADAKNRTPVSLTSSTGSTESTGLSGVIQSIGRVAAEAVEQAAFPLLLTLLIGAFLIGQNRIDSRDPKLALAPLDSEQDLLSFT